MSSTVKLNRAELRKLAGSQQVTDALANVGDQVAETAARSAPKDSGDGARSIHAEITTDSNGASVHVSWDRDHFYMRFHELGTSRASARPFLRPALDLHYNL